MASILGGQVSVGINGLAEFAPQIEAGTVRVLAVSSAQRLPGLDAPTLREQGVDVEFENWRSVVAPPGIDADERRRLEEVVAATVRSSEWREMLARYRWLDRYLAGEAFARFSAAEEQRVRDILRELGTGVDGTQSLRDIGPYPLFVLAGLVLFGVGSAGIRHRFRLRRAALADAAPRSVADTDFQKWRSVALIGIGVVLNLALAESAGFLVASALLFWFVARAFDEHHPVRDAAFAVAISVGAYLLFAQVLQLPLPAGVLANLL